MIAFLSTPAAHGGAPVERVETHASVVFLAGPNAYKLKRAVRYEYLDFSDAARRHALCEAEVRINRRTAPQLYRGVVAVTRERDGTLALGGEGTPVDWVIEMARFDQEDLLDRRATRNALDLALMRPLADAIARLHLHAEIRRDHGGARGMAWVIDGNDRDFRAQGRGVLDPAARDAVTAASRAALDRGRALLDTRREGGSVRQCHGDLHLRNIVLFEGVPTLFDAVEFNDEIACIDVLYDLAFLLMDLWRRRLPRHANAVWNRYLARTQDIEGIPLLPLFLSCRAAVRAKTSLASAALQDDETRRAALHDSAREYLAMALDLLRPPRPQLIAVGGLSGSGKSTLAHALAPFIGPAPGAVVLRSDEIRKRLCGVDESTRLGPEGYTPSVSERAYATLASEAARVVSGGHCAIVDAVFARPDDRAATEQAAARAGVPFTGFWLDAPERTLVSRVERRGRDVSDADAEVVRRQLAEDTGSIRWRRIDAGGSEERVLAEALAALQRSGPSSS